MECFPGSATGLDHEAKNPGRLETIGVIWVECRGDNLILLANCRLFAELRGGLLAWSNRTRQTAVVNAVGVVPQRLTKFNTTTQNFDLLWASRRSIGGKEVIVFVWDKVFIVAVTQDGFENVLAATHFSLSISPCD